MNTAASPEPQLALALKSKLFHSVFFSQSVCHFCSLVMSYCGEDDFSDTGLDWVEELCCMRAVGTILPQFGNH